MITYDKPPIVVDFGKGNFKTELPRLAEEALRNHGLSIRKLVTELHSYYRAKSLDDVKPYAIMQIVSKYVQVLPYDFRDMVKVLGFQAALKFCPGVEPPGIVWTILQELQAGPDTALATDYECQLLDLVENGAESVWDYYAVAAHYYYALRDRQPVPF